MMDLEIPFLKKDCNKSPAMEGIHGQMLINLSELGRRFRLDIFNTSWNVGKLPSDWKETLIIPIKNMTNWLMNSTVIDQSYLPASRTNLLRGLHCKIRDAVNLKPTNHTVAAFPDLSKALDEDLEILTRLQT
ncbi:hypothetical protein TNCV_423771 [Trichonephila clavipes]|nr:hypothetical protein TNCV_423771 [Trichonephila clavipes]